MNTHGAAQRSIPCVTPFAGSSFPFVTRIDLDLGSEGTCDAQKRRCDADDCCKLHVVGMLLENFGGAMLDLFDSRVMLRFDFALWLLRTSPLQNQTSGRLSPLFPLLITTAMPFCSSLPIFRKIRENCSALEKHYIFLSPRARIPIPLGPLRVGRTRDTRGEYTSY